MFLLNTSLNPSNVWKNIQNNLMFGTTFCFWGQLAVAAYSAYQGSKAQKASGQAGGQQAALTQEQIDFAKQNYEDYKTQYGGIDQDLIASLDEFASRETLQKYMGEGITDVRAAYGKQREMGERQMTRYGLDPSDPRYQAGDRESRLEETKSEVGVRNLAREKEQAAEDKLFARRLAVGQYGKKSSDKERMVLGAIGEGADLAGRQAEGYAKQAGAGYGLAGQFIGKAIDSYSPNSGVSDAPVWEVSDADTGELGW